MQTTVDDLLQVIGRLYVENLLLRANLSKQPSQQEGSAAQNGKPTIHEVLEAAESA
jgi:hypothetical protein